MNDFHQRMGQSYCTYSITMGYKGQMIGKRHLLAIFACLHSLKMLPVYCGSISFVVVSALTHCKSDRIPFSPFYCLYVVFGWFVLCQWPRIQEKSDFHLFPSASLSLHPSILFILVDLQNDPDNFWFKAEAAAEDRMPSITRHFVSYLLGAMTVFCLACRLSVCPAIFGSDYRTLCSLS